MQPIKLIRLSSVIIITITSFCTNKFDLTEVPTKFPPLFIIAKRMFKNRQTAVSRDFFGVRYSFNQLTIRDWKGKLHFCPWFHAAVVKCLGRQSYANMFEMMRSSMTKGENGYGDSLIQRQIQMLQVLPDFLHFLSSYLPCHCNLQLDSS